MEGAYLKSSQLFTPGNIGAHENQIWHINKPFRFSWFPYEIAPIPKAWAVTTKDLPPASEGELLFLSPPLHVDLQLVFTEGYTKQYS